MTGLSDSLIENRLPPHDMDAEESVIGSILLDPGCLVSIKDLVAADDFYSEACRLIFEVMTKVEHPNQITVGHQLANEGKIETVGGAAFLSHLVAVCPTPLDVEHYARAVKASAQHRRLIISAQAGDFNEAAKITQEMMAADLSVLTPKEHGDAMLALILGVQTQQRKGALKFGWVELDKATTGMMPGDFLVIGARPAHGKTEIMLETALYNARQMKIILFVSIEMGIDQICERELAMGVPTSIRKFRGARLSDVQWQGAHSVAGQAVNLPLYFLTGAVSSTAIYDRAAKMKREVGLDLIIVDYLQLLKECRDRKFGISTTERVGLVSSNLKVLAKELGVPVLSASQLSRGSEQRENKRPILSDLRESGNIEQDADVVLLLFREELYEGKNPGILAIKVAKHRQLGEQKTVKLIWNKKFHRYEDPSPEQMAMQDDEEEE